MGVRQLSQLTSGAIRPTQPTELNRPSNEGQTLSIYSFSALVALSRSDQFNEDCRWSRGCSRKRMAWRGLCARDSAGNANRATPLYGVAETKLEQGVVATAFAPQQQSTLERVPPVVETGVNTLSVDAGASPAGFSRAVVQLENNGPLHSGQLFPVREPGSNDDAFFLSLRSKPLSSIFSGRLLIGACCSGLGACSASLFTSGRFAPNR